MGSTHTITAITNCSIIWLAEKCPKLKQASFEGAVQLTTAALKAFYKNCPDLQYINISGTDKIPGAIKSTAFDFLVQSNAHVPKLKKIVLLNQDAVAAASAKICTVKRQNVQVCIGSTTGEGMKTFWHGKQFVEKKVFMSGQRERG
jgi:hypothetical protein